jgi:hypothetical protein
MAMSVEKGPGDALCCEKGPGDAPKAKMLVWSAHFSDHLQHVARVWKLEEDTHKRLVSLFDAKDDNCVVASNPEICFCFWAFAPSTQAWHVLLKFVLAVFRPRVYMTSETRDSFREIVMVVPCDRLSDGRHHDQWELWLQFFLEQFRVSGGAVVFVNCMSDQMIGAMERIHHGKQLKWNLTKHCNRDFGRLWMLLARERETQAMTRNITGLEYNIQTFVRNVEDRSQLLGFAQTAYARMREEKIHTMQLAFTVLCIQRLGLLNAQATDLMFSQLGVKPLWSNSELTFEFTREKLPLRQPVGMRDGLYNLISNPTA